MTYASLLLLQINKYLQYADKQEKEGGGGDTIGLHPTSEILFFSGAQKDRFLLGVY